jgi:hypothetical protein
VRVRHGVSVREITALQKFAPSVAKCPGLTSR